MNKLFEYSGKLAGASAIYGFSNLGVDKIGEQFDAKWLHKELFEVGNLDIEADDLIALPIAALIWFAIRK